jgi:hypothetical protein
MGARTVLHAWHARRDWLRPFRNHIDDGRRNDQARPGRIKPLNAFRLSRMESWSEILRINLRFGARNSHSPPNAGLIAGDIRSCLIGFIWYADVQRRRCVAMWTREMDGLVGAIELCGVCGVVAAPH